MKTYQIKHDDNVVIIGCGRLGSSIANAIANKNGSVTILDTNKEFFRKLSPSFGGLALEGDGTNIDVLKEVKIDKANVVIVVTDCDNTNIMIGQMAKTLFKVATVIIRLYESEKKCLYDEDEIYTILPSILSTQEALKILSI